MEALAPCTVIAPVAAFEDRGAMRHRVQSWTREQAVEKRVVRQVTLADVAVNAEVDGLIIGRLERCAVHHQQIRS